MNHPLIEQLKTEAAGLPEGRVEQLVCVLESILTAYDTEQRLTRAKEVRRIFRKAAIGDYMGQGLSYADALDQAETCDAAIGILALLDDAQDEHDMALGLFDQAANAANIGHGSFAPINYIRCLFAETGDYSLSNWAVDVNAAGDITVEKRERTVVESARDFGGALILRPFWAAGDLVRSPLSSSDFTRNLERAMDRNLRFGGSLRPSITITRDGFYNGLYEGGTLTARALDDVQKDLQINEPPTPSDHPHIPMSVEVGQGTEQPPRALDIPFAGTPPDGAKAAKIRGGMAYLNRQGKIIRIDYD